MDGEEDQTVVMILRLHIPAHILGSGIAAMRHQDKKDGDLASGLVRRLVLLQDIWLVTEDRGRNHLPFRGIGDGLEVMIMEVEVVGVRDRVEAVEVEVRREVLGLGVVRGMNQRVLARLADAEGTEWEGYMALASVHCLCILTLHRFQKKARAEDKGMEMGGMA